MNIESIKKRIAEVSQQKNILETQYNKIQQQLFILHGHINELQYQLNCMNEPSKIEPPKEPQSNNENLNDKEYIDKEMQVM